MVPLEFPNAIQIWSFRMLWLVWMVVMDLVVVRVGRSSSTWPMWMEVAGIEAAAILMRFRVILFGACFLRVIFVGTITGNRMTARCLFHGSFGIHINIWSFWFSMWKGQGIMEWSMSGIRRKRWWLHRQDLRLSWEWKLTVPPAMENLATGSVGWFTCTGGGGGGGAIGSAGPNASQAPRSHWVSKFLNLSWCALELFWGKGHEPWPEKSIAWHGEGISVGCSISSRFGQNTAAT